MRLQYLTQVFVIGALLAAGLCPGAASAQPAKQSPGQDAQDGKPADGGKPAPAKNPADVEDAFDHGQKAVKVATEREAKFKKLCDDFVKSIEKAPREPLNLKEEKIAWDRLEPLIESLSQDCEDLIRQLPKFKDEHELLLTAYDSSISGLQQCVKILDADAQKEKEDTRKDDYLLLARISRTCAEKLAARAKLASLKKLEVEKLVKAAEKDRTYFLRAAQVIKLVKMPLEREIVADEFLKRIQRYQQHREQFRKIMRDWSDQLEQTPPSPPIKVSSGIRKVPQAFFNANGEPVIQPTSNEHFAAAVGPAAWKDAEKGKDGRAADPGHTSHVPKVRFPRIVPLDKALVVVQLPAAAKLYLDDQLTTSRGSERTFVTPELEPGFTFTYTIRIELLQTNGKLVTETRRASFQAGRQVHVNFDEPPGDVQIASR